MGKGSMTRRADYRFSGPVTWALSSPVGALCGFALTAVLPPRLGPAGQPQVELILVAPFALLLLLIAVMPLIHERLWHV